MFAVSFPIDRINMANQFAEWTEQELSNLQEYPLHGALHVMALIPNRSKKGIQKKALRLGLERGVATSNKARARQFIPNITANFGWLTSMYQGDGFIINNEVIIGLISIDRELVEAFRHSLFMVFNDESILNVTITTKTVEELNRKNPLIKSRHPLYSIRVGARQLNLWLLEQTNQGTCIPEFITNASKEIRLAYLAGWMDSESFVGITKSNVIRSAIGVKSKPLMEEIKLLCTGLDIVTGAIRDNKSGAWVMNINISSLVDSGIKLVSKRKQKYLDEYVERYKN